jgi:uncharacterized membrane protein YcaP (DUF421 family)
MDEIVLALFGEGSHLDPLQMALRAVVIFALTLLMIRVSGRRSFGQNRAFDACTTVLLGAVLSRAVVGASPFWATIAAGTAIVVSHRLVGMASVRWPAFESFVSGDKRELVRKGVPDPGQMARALVTTRDLDEANRRKTGDERTPIERAVLERDGALTVVPARQDGHERRDGA